MKYLSTIAAFLLMAATAASAQLASHSPTVFKPAHAQATPTQVALNRPVARVNGSVLTEGDLLREEYMMFPYAEQHNGLPKALAPQIRDGAMKMIVFEELVYQEALRRKMTIPEAQMRKAEEEFRQQFATPEQFNRMLQIAYHGSAKVLRAKIRRSLLIDKFLKIEVKDKSSVTPAEVRAYYDKNPEVFRHPETYTFQTISILPPQKETAAQLKENRKRAEEALRQAKATRNADEFGLLAERISEDDYRVVMGQHKPVPVDQLAPQVVAEFRTMKPGEVSNVIAIAQAYTIVRLERHTPAGMTPFEEVKAKLTSQLQRIKREKLQASLDQRLRQNAKIEVL